MLAQYMCENNYKNVLKITGSDSYYFKKKWTNQKTVQNAIM